MELTKSLVVMDEDDANLKKKVTQIVILYKLEESRCAVEPTDTHTINTKQCEI